MQLFEADQHFPRVIAFTATPGNNQEQILTVLNNLKTKAVLSRFNDDPDVKPYVSSHKPKVLWVDLPQIYRDSIKIVERVEKDIVKEIKERGLQVDGYLSKTLAMDLQKQAVLLMKDDPEKGELLNYTPNLIRILHLRELIETQGLPQASTSITNWIIKPEKKTLREFLDTPLIKDLHRLISSDPIPHPKLQKMIELLQNRSKKEGSKIIIFSNFRNTVDFLYERLQENEIKCEKFVGQSSGSNSSKGMSQKEQLRVLEEFKNGNLNILISTSVGEEGLDVGSCDLVVFYDSVPSIVRSVQRTGRGRKRQSEVIRLVTKGTKDAAMYFATKRREKNVEQFVRKELPKIFKSEIEPVRNGSNLISSSKPKNLTDFIAAKKSGSNQQETPKMSNNSHVQKEPHKKSMETPPTNVDNSEILHDRPYIIIDPRERHSSIPRLLKQAGWAISLINLPAGDYKVSEQCIIERKTAEDFAHSVIDGRLFEQLSQKLTFYEKPIILLHGSLSNVTINISKNALTGALASIILDFKVPVLQVDSEEEAADLITALAKREQSDKKNLPKLDSISKKYPIKDIQRFVLGGIPGINRSKADQLLESFSTIKSLANADPTDISNLSGFGKTLANRIHKLMTHDYKEVDDLD
jgi:Fanconi anemia group M protein